MSSNVTYSKRVPISVAELRKLLLITDGRNMTITNTEFGGTYEITAADWNELITPLERT